MHTGMAAMATTEHTMVMAAITRITVASIRVVAPTPKFTDLLLATDEIGAATSLHLSPLATRLWGEVETGASNTSGRARIPSASPPPCNAPAANARL